MVCINKERGPPGAWAAIAAHASARPGSLRSRTPLPRNPGASGGLSRAVAPPARAAASERFAGSSAVLVASGASSAPALVPLFAAPCSLAAPAGSLDPRALRRLGQRSVLRSQNPVFTGLLTGRCLVGRIPASVPSAGGGRIGRADAISYGIGGGRRVAAGRAAGVPEVLPKRSRLPTNGNGLGTRWARVGNMRPAGRARDRWGEDGFLCHALPLVRNKACGACESDVNVMRTRQGNSRRVRTTFVVRSHGVHAALLGVFGLLRAGSGP